MQEIITLKKGDSGSQSCISISNDGLMLAVSGEDGTVVVWQGSEPQDDEHG